MAKGQMRGNREAKKPKQNKPKVIAAASPYADSKGKTPPPPAGKKPDWKKPAGAKPWAGKPSGPRPAGSGSSDPFSNKPRKPFPKKPRG